MKRLILIFGVLFLATSLHAQELQDLQPRHASRQVVSNDCAVTFEFKIGHVEKDDLIHMWFRWPRLCKVCFLLNTDTDDTLVADDGQIFRNPIRLDTSYFGHGYFYGPDFVEFHYVSLAGSLATGTDTLHFPVNCGYPGGLYGIYGFAENGSF